ncbi:hypothetical protein B0J11DRAFT_570299 [Dendryphion nanum]|uniref:Uncharacterized protein n=1 Tax=Dendryphion nanum TaxID=256645 RepID=A0A9P9DIQ0_9PLEO|nr:hypothetical protein B0J11DRAFT_570299 [Dendryphion nanum]
MGMGKEFSNRSAEVDNSKSAKEIYMSWSRMVEDHGTRTLTKREDKLEKQFAVDFLAQQKDVLGFQGLDKMVVMGWMRELPTTGDGYVALCNAKSSALVTHVDDDIEVVPHENQQVGGGRVLLLVLFFCPWNRKIIGIDEWHLFFRKQYTFSATSSSTMSYTALPSSSDIRLSPLSPTIGSAKSSSAQPLSSSPSNTSLAIPLLQGPTNLPRPSSPSSPGLPPSQVRPLTGSPYLDSILDWSLKVLGVAAAVLFGIWAPISYKAANDGNKANDETQQEMISKLEAMGKQAAQGSTHDQDIAAAIRGVGSRMDQLATLRLWEFCDGKSHLVTACASMTNKGDINSAVSNVVNWIPPYNTIGAQIHSTIRSTAHGIPNGTPTSAPSKVPASGTPISNPKKPVDISLVLVAVFAGFLLLSSIISCLALCYRLRKRRREGEKRRSTRFIFH